MWPSFSLCAWRILKIRSCLHNPLAPGKSKDRAILVSSVIFFSLSSAMVIRHLRRDFQRGVAKGDLRLRGTTGGADLCSPPLRLVKMFRFGQNRLTLGVGNLVQDLVHGLLDPSVRLVKLTGRLGSKLTQHVAIAQSLQGVK